MGTTPTVNYKFNIVDDDGDPSSVTVFLEGGGQLVATKEHKAFARILEALNGAVLPSDRDLKGMFDLGVAIGDKMKQVTERVTIKDGGVYLDHDRLAGPLVDAIVRFYEADLAGVVGATTASGVPSYQPLVAFLEKVQQNPNPHSRDQLFRWLEKHHYAIADDGDFIAYKGVTSDGLSINAGGAFVNGVWKIGRIPNVPGTVIEMPRSKVNFDPKQGCSTGLHVGNYGYARGFAQGQLLRCKVNPRDVVSVPTDSGDAKVRVCRYYVLDRSTDGEDKSVLFAGAYKTVKLPEPAQVASAEDTPAKPKRPSKRLAAKKAAAKKAAPKKKAAAAKAKPKPVEETWPEHYEDFKTADFKRLGFKEMQWLAKEWGVTVPAPRSRDEYVATLVKEARNRLRRFARESK